jgi:thymidylate synthase
MKQYHDIVKHVLDNGIYKGNRTGIGTIACPNVHFSYDMSEGFPLLTTKKIAWKTMAVELEGFIHGITDKRWYQDRGCRIWDEWHNPKSNDDNDLGPIYGHNWRSFNKKYGNSWLIKILRLFFNSIDQFDYIVQTLKKNPNDRRMVCSAWNPNQLHIMALPPCHFAWVVTHIDGVLNLHWTQRSCDLFLGVPFNIASYGLLLELLCKESNMKPGNLSGMLCDCHIYENHIEQCKEQLSRESSPRPTLNFTKWDGIYNWTHKDIEFHNYNPHPPIKAPVAI